MQVGGAVWHTHGTQGGPTAREGAKGLLWGELGPCSSGTCGWGTGSVRARPVGPLYIAMG